MGVDPSAGGPSRRDEDLMPVEVTGLDALTRGLAAFPDVVARGQRAAAEATAAALAGDLRAELHARGWTLANEIDVIVAPSAQLIRIEVNPRPPRPANLPLWLEFGTRHMPARPFMLPAVIRARAAHPARAEAALQASFDETGNR